MNSTPILSGQSFLNKVIECTGNVENAVEVALLNGVSFTDDLQVGKTIQFDKITNKIVARFFEFKKPATQLTTEQQNNLKPQGIGFMVLENSFEVY